MKMVTRKFNGLSYKCKFFVNWSILNAKSVYYIICYCIIMGVCMSVCMYGKACGVFIIVCTGVFCK